MSWLKIDPIEIKKHPKFHAFRKKLDWQPHHAFGFLCAFWGEVANTEANESGDISDWTPDYLADRIVTNNVDPNRLWEALVLGYIEVRPNERFIVRDWIEIAGDFLREKWRSRKDGPEHLTIIWSNYGRIYGNKKGHESDPPVGLHQSHSETTVDPEKGPMVPHTPPFPQKGVELFIPSGSGDETPLGEESQSPVTTLQNLYLEKLTERLSPEKPTGFSWGASGVVFKRLISTGLTVHEIAERFDPWFRSTDRHIVKRSFPVTDYPTYFPRLKDGPITANQENANGRKKAYDGADAFTDERAQEVQREIDAYQRSISERVER